MDKLKRVYYRGRCFFFVICESGKRGYFFIHIYNNEIKHLGITNMFQSPELAEEDARRKIKFDVKRKRKGK